jgi:hypothetical protein
VETLERQQAQLTKKTAYMRKLKRATHLLFYRRHRRPGVKGWELRKRLGSDYPKVLDLLDSYLERLDLKVKTVFEGETPTQKPSLEQLDRARFFITLRGGLAPKETKMSGWRIDDIAGLAIAISFIISKKGKVARTDVENLLRNKLPGWRVDINIDRYIRAGYLTQDENQQLYLDWRTRAEVDEKALVDLLLTFEGEKKQSIEDNA